MFLIFSLLFISSIGYSQNETINEKSFLQNAKDEIGLSGSLRPAYWLNNKRFDNQKNFFITSYWINLKPKEILDTRATIEFYQQYENLSRKRDGFSEKNKPKTELREAHLETSFGPFDFRLGRQIIVWGRADKVNPTDQLSTKNMIRLFTDDEDQRLGIFSFLTTYNFEPFRLIGVWQPEWRNPVYPIPKLNGTTLRSQKPKDTNKQFAIKLDHSGTGGLDWSLSYFNGINRIPDLDLTSASASGVTLGLNFNRVQVIGGDLAFNLGEYGFRAESAYTKTIDHKSDNPYLQNSNLFSVIGVDRTIIEDFNLNFQIMHKLVSGFRDANGLANSSDKTVGTQLSILSIQENENNWGATMRPSLKLMNQNLEAEVAWVLWISRFSSLLRPKLSYSFSDSFKTVFGGEIYTGNSQSFFGRLATQNTVFLEGRFLF